MVNVFGNYLKEIEMYPDCEEHEENLPTSYVSKNHDYNFLASISMNKIEGQLAADSFESCIEEAFEFYFLIEKLGALPEAAIHRSKASSTPD